MKTKQLPKLAMLATTLFAGALVFAQPAPPTGKKWVKAEYLSDEFNGTNSNADLNFDTTKWTKSLWQYAGTPCNMVAGNSGVSGGNLWIKATLDNSNALWFKTSRVQSKAQVGFPMYTECRIKAANISAYTTYWLNNGDINNRNEIDICENNPKPSITSQNSYRPYTMYSQYFIVKNGVTERNYGNFDNRNLSNSNPAKGKKWNEAYQILGCYWKDSKNVQFYINGEPAGSIVSTQNFTIAQNIIWDLWTQAADWLGGVAIKSDLNNNSWNTMYVDWIHTYTTVNVTAKDEIVTKTELLNVNEKSSVFPNPVVDHLFISLKSSTNYHLYTVTNLIGKTVLNGVIANSDTNPSVNVSSLQSGQYILTLRNDAENESIKFIKK